MAFSSLNLFAMRINQEKIVLIIFVLMFVAFSALLPNFLTSNNITLLLQSVSVLGILGVGMSIVVIGRGIDLSMVATMAMAASWSLDLMGHNVVSWPVGLLIGLFAALAVGLANGLLVAYAEIPPLFATLAVGSCVYGFGRLELIHQDVVYVPPSIGWLSYLGQGRPLGLPMPVVVFAVVALIVSFLLRETKFGRFLYAIGDNYATARATGVPIRPVLISQYMLTSAIAFIAGFTQAMAVNSMNTRVSDSLLIYDVILIVVLGGVGLSGGKGSVRNVLVGTLLIGVFLNGMTILNVTYTVQSGIKSLILLVAILIDSAVNPRDEQTAQHGDI
jgi:ribose transport system permease protein